MRLRLLVSFSSGSGSKGPNTRGSGSGSSALVTAELKNMFNTWKKPGDPVIRSPTEIQFLRRRRAKLRKTPKYWCGDRQNYVKKPKKFGAATHPTKWTTVGDMSFFHVCMFLCSQSSIFLAKYFFGLTSD